GGALKSLTLKKFHESSTPGSKLVSLVSATGPEGFALGTESSGLGIPATVLYTSSARSLTVSGSEKKQLSFTWTSPLGVSIKKTYTFSGDSYAIALDTQLTNFASNIVSGSLDILLPHPSEPPSGLTRFEYNNAVTFEDDAFTTEKVKDLVKEPQRYVSNVGWTGYADKYFLSAILSEKNSIASVMVQKGKGSYIDTLIASPVLDLKPGQTKSLQYRMFFGPKGLDILKAQGQNLEKALDLGWFSAIATPLLQVLKFFYKYTHNYGIAIIIITIIIKILFFPLTHKSYKSMKDMQKIQPKMAELKEKYKNDRDALNRSIMELYRTHKVNPLGGCLPMFIQIPVFFALYKALMFSIELRHAPFMLWITDLSAKDPYYVTPVIMGATMFIQQKMTPSSMDPMQAKMMLALPIVFTFMFLNFPSGLVIYWLVNNILTIAQQVYINKTLKDA
ncbi:MAG TPA: membrane protein insertase YidC, partial [Syntrophales bacterium]|nr:membrane protein insertase YidC [Syntrophales bacterium]